MSDKYAALVDAIRRCRIAERDLAQTRVAQWPVDTAVKGDHGGHPQYGVVVGHGGDSLRAKNDRTGKPVWVSGYKILCAAGRENEVYA